MRALLLVMLFDCHTLADNGENDAGRHSPLKEASRKVMLDLRWNRTDLNSVSRETYETVKKPANMGPYEPTEDERAVLLGEKPPAVVGSGIFTQVAVHT